MLLKYRNYQQIFFFMLILLMFFMVSCELEITGNDEANPYLVYQSIEIDPRTIMNFAVLLPEQYDPLQSYPVLLALPPGEQTMSHVNWAIDLYYIRQSIQRNWIVISPSAVNDITYYEGSEIYIPMLLDWVEERFNVEGEEYHIAGISSGGVSAFHIGIMYPEKFQSLTVFPGGPLEEDERYLNNLVDMPITMYVGGLDDQDVITWMDSTVSTLKSLGANVVYKKWANDGHVITSLTPAYLFNVFDGYRPEFVETNFMMNIKSDLILSKSDNQYID